MKNRNIDCVAAHDISCLGKCSLTAVLPIMNAAGLSVGLLPTALLSNQTGGLNIYSYLDLTDEMDKIIDAWKKQNVRFGSVYSGFISSGAQARVILRARDELVEPGGLFVCDPAMADGGRLYATIDGATVEALKELCRAADVITPNVTECAILLGLDPQTPYSPGMERELKEKYSLDCCVVTGVERDGLNGCVYCSENAEGFAGNEKIEGMFHSTGDVFASALTAKLLKGCGIDAACRFAADFVAKCIRETVKCGGDSRYGLALENCLGDLTKREN